MALTDQTAQFDAFLSQAKAGKLAKKLTKGKQLAAEQANKAARIESETPEFVDPLGGPVIPLVALALGAVVLIVVIGRKRPR